MALLHDSIAQPQRIRTVRPARGRIVRQGLAPRKVERVDHASEQRSLVALVVAASTTIFIVAFTALWIWLTILRPLDAASQVVGDVAGALMSQPSSANTPYHAEKAFQAAQSKLTRDLANCASRAVIDEDRKAVAVRFQAFKRALEQR